MLADTLPDDLSAAHAMILELTAALKTKDDAVAAKDEAIAHRDAEVSRLTLNIKRLQRHQFGKRSEKLDEGQLALRLEDLEAAVAEAEARVAASRAAHTAPPSGQHQAPPPHDTAPNCRRPHKRMDATCISGDLRAPNT